MSDNFVKVKGKPMYVLRDTVGAFVVEFWEFTSDVKGTGSYVTIYGYRSQENGQLTIDRECKTPGQIMDKFFEEARMSMGRLSRQLVDSNELFADANITPKPVGGFK